VAQADSTPPVGDQNQPNGTFGEQPDLDTARDVALREQGALLLRGGEVTLEADIFYSRTDRNVLAPIEIAPGFIIPGLATARREAVTALLVGRFGLMDNLQLVASVPYQYRTDELTGAGADQDRSSKSGFGDVGLSTRYALLQESWGRPGMIVSADAQIPTDGSGAFALGGGVSLVKSIDPVALFASVNYLHQFNSDSRDLEDLEADNTFNSTLGFAFAMNDRLSLGTALTGTFNRRSEHGDRVVPSDETYSLRFSLTSLLHENLYIEPSVSFRLNGPGSAMTFGLSLPYSFAD
jgi:hypothetical protein